MKVQKPYDNKDSNTFSHKKIHRRVHTEIDDPANIKPIKTQLKKTQRTSSKPKFIDVYSKYNIRQSNIQKKTNFKVLPPKQTYTVKHLYTQPDQIQKRQSSKKRIKLQGKNRYQVDGVAGKGTFGVVFFGRDKQTGEKIAVKKVFQDKKYKNREHIILQMLKHPNVLQMKDSYLSYQGEQEYLNIIMDYYSDNLYQVIKKKQIGPTLIKLYSYQIFRALNYLAMISIAHRDMKPQNILVDQFKHKAIICDFGSAKKLVKTQANLAYICSRCYRAPELIFGATNYTQQIDVWSMGCILVQMVNGHPPFLADSQIDQLIQIIKVLGTPSQVQVQQMNPKYDMRQYSKFPKIKSTLWKNLLKTKDMLLIDLICKSLQYSPVRRITPAQALFHQYFDQLRDEAKFFQMKQRIKTIPELFDFSQDQLDYIYSVSKSKKILVPKWYKSQKKSISFKPMKPTISTMITKPPSNQGSRLGGNGVSQGVNVQMNVPKKTLMGFRVQK